MNSLQKWQKLIQRFCELKQFYKQCLHRQYNIVSNQQQHFVKYIHNRNCTLQMSILKAHFKYLWSITCLRKKVCICNNSHFINFIHKLSINRYCTLQMSILKPRFKYLWSITWLINKVCSFINNKDKYNVTRLKFLLQFLNF